MRELPKRPVKVERWACETANAQDYASEHEAYIAEAGATIENWLLDHGSKLDDHGVNSAKTRAGFEYLLRIWPREIKDIADTCAILADARRDS